MRPATAAAAAAAAALFATPAAAQEGPAASWFAANPAARAAVLERCENDPGRLHLHPDCVNARNGEVRAMVQELDRKQRATPAPPVRAARPPVRRGAPASPPAPPASPDGAPAFRRTAAR